MYAQRLQRRHRWFAKIDMRRYFDSIAHDQLLRLLRRRFKSAGLLRLFRSVVTSFEKSPGHGLPIGSLTSQYFANHYLSPLDRRLQGDPAIRGFVRYMDDVVWWCDTRSTAGQTAKEIEAFVRRECGLELKAPAAIQRTDRGLGFCGFAIHRHRLLLSRRRRKRYLRARRRAEPPTIWG